MKKEIKSVLSFFIQLSWLPFHASNALATGRKSLATALPGQVAEAGGRGQEGKSEQ